MNTVVIAGVGMTPFGRSPGLGLRAMAEAAITEAIADASIPAPDIDRVFFGNAVAATVTQQDMVKGQVALRHGVLDGASVINVENACASGSSAFNLAVGMIAGGQSEIVLAVGAEQLTHAHKERSFRALRGAADIIEIGEAGPDEDWTQSVLMRFYAEEARGFMARTDVTVEDFARVSVKNRHHASLNPRAQFRAEQTIQDVLLSRLIADPLTITMCSPMTDGAAAAVLMSEGEARRRGIDSYVRVLASEVRGWADGHPVEFAARAAYEKAGLGVTDFDLIELHDAAATAEIIQYGEIGLVPYGDEASLIRDGATSLGGRIPVNVSGGLLSRGHAIGATGLAQIYELATQLRSRAADRQVEGAARALAVNTGGWVAGDYAVAVASVLEAV